MCKVLVWVQKDARTKSLTLLRNDMGEQTTPIITIMAELTASKSERAEELIFFSFFSDVLFVRLPVWTSHREIDMEGRFPGIAETM